MNNKLLNMTLKLILICSAAALILGIVNIITEPIIIERKRIEQEKALKELSDGDHVGDLFSVSNNPIMHETLMLSLLAHGVIGKNKEIDENKIIQSIYPVDKDGEVIKYILQLQGKGYAGKMILLAVFRTDGSFLKAKLIENNETPNLGKKAEESSYYNMFAGTGSDNSPVPISKRDLKTEDAEAVTGSTITYNGIAKTLALGSDYVKLLGGEN